jgi:hypothetical protein
MKSRTGLALVAICFAAAGCGSSEGERSVSLVWKTPPKLYVPSDLPRDRIVRGVIENQSLKRKVTLKASDIKLLDRDGRRIEGVATFISGYAHSIYPSFRKPGGSYPESEQLRLGMLAKLKAGQSAPLTVSWHDPPGPRTPIRIDYGSGTLTLPKNAEGGKKAG